MTSKIHFSRFISKYLYLFVCIYVSVKKETTTNAARG